jgi:hypothetical protein
VEQRGPAARDFFARKRGRGEMIKAPIVLQDLRRRIYVKAKSESLWRFKRHGFGWKRWSREWLYERALESGTSMIGHINFDTKRAGARSAGYPHAACDVEGAGNGVTDDPKRARKGKPWIQAKGTS